MSADVTTCDPPCRGEEECLESELEMTKYLAERDRKAKGKNLDSVTKYSLDRDMCARYAQPSFLAAVLGGFKTLWTKLGSIVQKRP